MVAKIDREERLARQRRCAESKFMGFSQRRPCNSHRPFRVADLEVKASKKAASMNNIIPIFDFAPLIGLPHLSQWQRTVPLRDHQILSDQTLEPSKQDLYDPKTQSGSSRSNSFLRKDRMLLIQKGFYCNRSE